MKIIEYLFRGIGVLAAVSLFFLGLAVTIYTVLDGFEVVAKIVTFQTTDGKVIYQALGILDLLLLGLSIFIASMGIYELFVKPIPGLPEWMQVKDIDALKSMLIKIVVVVMGISFLGRAVTWDGNENILHYGLTVAAVIIALSYFLSVKIEYDKKP
ncbi:MAG: YqhA family protein [Bacteroidota bacterium]